MSGEKNFLSHFLTIGSGTIINMFLALITTPVITRLVSPNDYGEVSIFTMYANIALMVLCLGLDQALVRFYYDKKNIEYKRGLLKICICIPTVISIICSVIIIFLSNKFQNLFEFQPLIMTLLCIYIIILIWNRIALLLLRTSYQSRKYATCNVLYRAIYVVMAIGLITKVQTEFFLCLVIANIVAMLIPTIFAIASTSEQWKFNKAEKLKNKKEILLYGLPFILSMGLTSIFQAIDKMSLNKYCSYAEVGVYSSAMTLVSIFAIIQTTFNALWSPMQIEHYVKDPEDKSFIQKGNQFITIIMFLLGFVLILGKDIFALLLGEKYREAAYILPFLIFNPIMYTVSETTQGGIDFSKKSYLNIVIALVACITNYIGNTVLVPNLGCRGAAISTGISYIVFFAGRTFFSKLLYPVDYKLWKFSIITIETIIYAYYNTFYKFSPITIVLFCICVLSLILLYSQSLKNLINYGIKQLKDITRKKV